MSISSSLDENILASAADQLTAASRAAFCITAPMMKMTEHCVAVMASGGFGLTLIEITGSTNLDTVVYLAAYVDFGNAAALGFHHVLTAYLANSAHMRTSSLIEKLLTRSVLVDVVVPEPAVVLHRGQMEARIAFVLFMLDDDGLAFIIRAAARQVSSFDQFLKFFVGHVLHLFLVCRWCPAHDHIRSEQRLSQVIFDTYGGKELLQRLGFAILIDDNQFIRFFEASLRRFRSVPDDSVAGDGAKSHLRVVADLMIQFPAHRGNSFFQIICQLNIILEFRWKRCVQIAEQGASDTFGVAADRLSAFIFMLPTDIV